MKGAGFTAEQQAAAIRLIAAVGEAIRDLSKGSPFGGVPSGELYAFLMGQGFTLASYGQVIEMLKSAKLVTEDVGLLKWVGPKGGDDEPKSDRPDSGDLERP